MKWNNKGYWSEKLLISEDRLILVPNVFKNELDAATFRVNPFTAYRILKDFVPLNEGVLYWKWKI